MAEKSLARRSYREVWLVDFEFNAPAGERPTPVCMVAKEARSGRLIRMWSDELISTKGPAFDIGQESLYVAYFSSAEFGCHLALGWPLPRNVLDLYVEFRNHVNGLGSQIGYGLLGALAYFGIDGISTIEKESMREKILSGGPWSQKDKKGILDYCQSDVDPLVPLLQAIEPFLDLPRALLRGRFMTAVAAMEFAGIPWDVEAFGIVSRRWHTVKERLIGEVDRSYGVFENGSFKADRFENYLIQEDIPWPRLESGALDLADNTFREMSRPYPQISALREVRSALSKLRLTNLAVGLDGRNRCLLSPFMSRTSRNQPSTTKFAFGPDTWVRSFIKPGPGRGIAYIDFEQQEFGIAASLSGDEKMIEAYLSGDPYLQFGKQSGLIPTGGSKETHKGVRDLCKTVILGVQYGMGSRSLAGRIGRPGFEAKDLLRLHHETYKTFWAWSDSVVDYAHIYSRLWTTYGWHIRYAGELNPRSVRNFPMQANGAEMLRLAIVFALEKGVRVIAPIHDAILIEAHLEELEDAVLRTEVSMAEASRAVLKGFEIRTEAEIVRYPNRYRDKRGQQMWNTVWSIIAAIEPLDHDLLQDVTGGCHLP